MAAERREKVGRRGRAAHRLIAYRLQETCDCRSIGIVALNALKETDASDAQPRRQSCGRPPVGGEGGKGKDATHDETFGGMGAIRYRSRRRPGLRWVRSPGGTGGTGGNGGELTGRSGGGGRGAALSA